MLKASKISTMPSHHGGREFIASAELLEIFIKLKQIVNPYTQSLDVRIDTSVQYELWTRHAFRTKSFRPKHQRGILFVGLAICRLHVGLYFYPLHIDESLASSIPIELKKLLKGASAFHIKTLDDSLIEQIKVLFQLGWKDYSNRGWVDIKTI